MYPISYRKGCPVPFGLSKVKPRGCRGKIILAPRGLRYFSRQPCTILPGTVKAVKK